MKKTKLQVLIEFTSMLQHIKASKKSVGKVLKNYKKRTGILAAVAVAVMLLSSSANATTYYSRANGNWNVNSSWSTVTYGSPINTGTYPRAGDVANIGDGYTISINTSVSSATINIGQGISGILQYNSAANYTATVSGNVLVNTGARFWYNISLNRTHTLNVGGDFTNFGIVDFFINSSQAVNVTFNTAANSTISGSGTWDLRNVTLNKTSGLALFDIQAPTFEGGIKTFIGTSGTYLHNNTSSYSINPTVSTFTIGPNMTYRVPLGTMRFASLADNVYLQGALYVNGGNVFIGTAAGNQGLRSDQNGTTTPYLQVSSGNLTVYGGITYGSSSVAEPFQFNMSGGTILLNSGTTGTNRQVFYINDVANSSFVMSNGIITLQKPNTAGFLTFDAGICGTNGTVTTTGGTIEFGNAFTPTGRTFNFRPFASAAYPHLKISGTAGALITLATSASSSSDFRLLSLEIGANKTFDIRSATGTAGDSKLMTLLQTANGSDALLNNGTFLARTGNVTFNTTGAQAIGGSSTTTFYNLAINNTSNITLNRTANVSNFLSLVNGNLITTSSNILTCLSGANANLGSGSSYVNGPMIHTWATNLSTTKTFPIGKGSSYRPVVLTVQHSNLTSVTYQAEIINSSATALPFSLPPSLAGVSKVRYVQFNRQSVSNFTNGTIQMYYDVDDGVANKNTLQVAHDDGVSQWQNIGGTATADWTGNIISNVFTNFNSYFSLANPPGGGNPLPVELTSFTAKPENNDVHINWTTSSELNSDYFTLERSKNNIEYQSIASVEAAGNSSVVHLYAHQDREPLNGTSYYRLKQTDIDGQSTYYRPVTVFRNTKNEFQVFPNPTVGSTIRLRSSDKNLNQYKITVQDLNGKVIPTSISSSGIAGELNLTINEPFCIFGRVYFISAVGNQEVFREKLIVGMQ